MGGRGPFLTDIEGFRLAVLEPESAAKTVKETGAAVGTVKEESVHL